MSGWKRLRLSGYAVIYLTFLGCFVHVMAVRPVPAADCEPDGNYVLLTVTNLACYDPGMPLNPPLSKCDCYYTWEHTQYSGLPALVAVADEAVSGEPADPDGGQLPCTKDLTCLVVSLSANGCITTDGELSFSCAGDIQSESACFTKAVSVPNVWAYVSQASTCD